MKTIQLIAPCALALLLSGCATNSSVRKMIDASIQEESARADAQAASIDVLKQSAVVGLEAGKENTATIAELQAELAELRERTTLTKGLAEASNLMSAANTVKLAELDETLETNSAADAETKQLLMEIDKLYEGVMISHYQMIADSATAAVEALKADGWAGGTNAPINLDEPIEISAPETSPTNGAVKGASAVE